MSISLKNDAGTFRTNLNQSNPTANVNIALPTTSGTMAKVEDKLVLGTAQTASGTSIDFTGIPSWAKRITVMFMGVSLSGTSSYLIQLGSGTIQTTGYSSISVVTSTSVVNSGNKTNGIVVMREKPTSQVTANISINIVSGNSFVSSHSGISDTATSIHGGGMVTLPAILDRVRITTVNGTDTFDAGTINIMWE